MTSFAFILGVLPLVFASGAGRNGRHSLGTAVFGGMLVSTLLNLFFIPVLYLIIESWREGGEKPSISNCSAAEQLVMSGFSPRSRQPSMIR